MIVSVAVAILCAVNRAGAQESVQFPATIVGTVSGRLATVEPARRRITLVPIGESHIVELVIAERTEIMHAERAMSLPELVREVRSLVTVAYRFEGDRRVAERITIEASAG